MIKIEELLAPMTTEQKVKFSMYCALEVSKDQEFISWAKKWLSGEDTKTSILNKYKRSEHGAVKAVTAHIWLKEATNEIAKWTATQIESGLDMAIEYAFIANPKIDLEKLAQKAMEE